MVNYKKTEEFFKKENVPYDRFKTGDQMSEERWFEQVKNSVTGEFFQLEILKAAGVVSSDFMLPPGFENKRFPVITVNSIYRIKAGDGKEYLKSRQMHYGLDRLGNISTNPLTTKKCMINPYGNIHNFLLLILPLVLEMLLAKLREK